MVDFVSTGLFHIYTSLQLKEGLTYKVLHEPLSDQKGENRASL